MILFFINLAYNFYSFINWSEKTKQNIGIKILNGVIVKTYF